jgi:hypothetical protein
MNAAVPTAPESNSRYLGPLGTAFGSVPIGVHQSYPYVAAVALMKITFGICDLRVPGESPPIRKLPNLAGGGIALEPLGELS